METITPKMEAEIKGILSRGNTAEIKKTKDSITLLETKREKRISVPVNGQE